MVGFSELRGKQMGFYRGCTDWGGGVKNYKRLMDREEGVRREIRNTGRF